MSFVQILILLFLFAVTANVFAVKIKVPFEIFLLLASLLVSLIPPHPIITLEPHTLLFLFLPPIVFYAAYFTSWRDFKANKRPISLLAIGFVLFVMCLVAITLMFLIPNIPWAICFLFGAIVSPTDASSAVALVRKLNIPKRLITIIEGESLLNDATALVAYRYALIAVLTGSWSFWYAGLNFVFSALSAIILGLVIGLISLRFYVWLNESKAQSLFSLLIPYCSFLIADKLGVSAIISLVTCGIVVSRKFRVIVSAESRQKTRAIWEIYIFSLTAIVFIMIGLQLPFVIQGLNGLSTSQIVLYIIVINFVIILSRLVWVFPAAYIPRFIFKSIRKKDPYPHWSELVTLGWIGMRGAVSLILVMSLPYYLPSGQAFPYRSLLILLTYSVIIITLLLPTFTLPLLDKVFHFKKDVQQLKEEALARIETTKLMLSEIEKAIAEQPEISDHSEQLRKRHVRNLEVLKSNLQETPYSTINPEEQKIRKFTKKLLNIERNLLINLWKNASINEEVFHKLEEELDLDEMKLKTPRI